MSQFGSRLATLQLSYLRLVLDGRAVRSGDLLEVSVVEPNPVAGDAIRVDAVTLAPLSATLAELAIDSHQALHLGNTSRYVFVIIQESQYAHIAAIKAANPHTKVFAYMEAPVVQHKSCSDPSPPAHSPHDSFGINYCFVAKYHPDWFLTGRAGNRQSYSDFPDCLAVDVGNAGYRSLWSTNVAAAVRADGFDGVYLDDVNTHPGHGLDGRIAKFSDQQYGNATVGFVRSVADNLTAHGLLTIANVGVDPWVSWQAEDTSMMARHLTAVNKEFYSRWGSVCGAYSARFSAPATQGNPPLTLLQDFQTNLEAQGAHLTGIDYGPTPTSSDAVTAMSYGRASFLMAWDGRPGSAYMFRPCGVVDPANAAWTTELGLPTGPRSTVNGMWERPFTNGLTLLNPSATRRATVAVDGTFVTPSGRRVSGHMTVEPATALLLKRISWS